MTSPKLCIARFHGRNTRTWYRPPGPTSADRFDWLYSPQELGEWVPGIREAAARGTPVHVLLNNNRSNYAVVNAFDAAALLDLRPLRPPPPILDRMVERDGHEPAWVRDAVDPPPMPEPSPPVAGATTSGQGTLDLGDPGA